MKNMLAVLVLSFASACGGPEVPKAFAPDSPASGEAPSAKRLSVADVLAAPNPVDAQLCNSDRSCAWGENQSESAVDEGKSDAGHGHHHGHEH